MSGDDKTSVGTMAEGERAVVCVCPKCAGKGRIVPTSAWILTVSTCVCLVVALLGGPYSWSLAIFGIPTLLFGYHKIIKGEQCQLCAGTGQVPGIAVKRGDSTSSQP